MASSSPHDREERESRSPNPKRAPTSPRNKRRRSRSRSRSSSPDGGKRHRREDVTVPVCRDFLRRVCFRNAVDCKFAHPPPSVSVEQDKVTVCGDSLRKKCFRGDTCRYFHPPPHLQESSSKEIGLELEEEKPKTICRDFLRGKCARSEKECRFLHYSSANNHGVACQDFLRGKCERKSCHFSHASARDIPPVHYPHRAPIFYPPSPPRYSQSEETVQVCKDFLNGMCNRNSCKYLHPNLQPMSYGQHHYERLERRTYSPPRTSYDEETVQVCKDFLNGMCNRDLCRYLHPRIEPPGLAKTVYGTLYNNAALNRLASPPRNTYGEENTSICRDFTKGLCNRNQCKFYHHKIEHKIFEYESGLDFPRSPHRYESGLDFPQSPHRYSYERETDDVCRDFMNGLCNRVSCKFVHSIPEPTLYERSYREAPLLPQSPPRTAQGERAGQVCRDFLNGLCDRKSCKFVHAISEPNVFRQSYNPGPFQHPSPPRIAYDDEMLMVCRDFLNKMCRRKSCKYAHPSSDTNVVNGRVEICRDFCRGGCGRTVCHFYHPKTKH